MSDWKENVEELVYQSRIKVPYTWAVGATGSRFLGEIKDNQVIFANRSPQTGKTFVPPKRNCPETFAENEEWVPLNGKGVVKSFTVCRYDSLARKGRELPGIYALIHLEGADNSILHFLGEVEDDKVKTGMEVEPVFREKCEGDMLDIKYFRPVS